MHFKSFNALSYKVLCYTKLTLYVYLQAREKHNTYLRKRLRYASCFCPQCYCRMNVYNMKYKNSAISNLTNDQQIVNASVT